MAAMHAGSLLNLGCSFPTLLWHVPSALLDLSPWPSALPCPALPCPALPCLMDVWQKAMPLFQQFHVSLAFLLCFDFHKMTRVSVYQR